MATTAPLLSSQRARPASLPLPRRLPPPHLALPLAAPAGLRLRRAPAPCTAKFGKFDASDAPAEAEEAEVATAGDGAAQQAEEDDSCLPSDLEGAIRQSGKASADFVNSGGLRAIAELLIPQLEFLNEEGAQAELWALSRIFLDTLVQETGQKVTAIFPDAGAAALLKYQWKDAQFKCSSLSDRKPVDAEDEVAVMIIPDHQMLESVERIASKLSDDPIRPLVMWNPRLVSGDVGVGFNVRNLRRNFLSTFTTVYSMRPLPTGAIFRCYPGNWKVFYDDPKRPNRYLLARELTSRPDATDIERIFGGVDEQSEGAPSLLNNVKGVFSSVSQFMRVISK
ncbi:uncharacterized protein LOC133926233 [Phragmites australis]|uniref:uncharacterized protein LOC133926233 n=1 Tax=Phragmites australis TaxID=29695 RepID=UPI002D798F01|nr:uncharacterized protein LOC133926233 [Phragmites australis]